MESKSYNLEFKTQIDYEIDISQSMDANMHPEFVFDYLSEIKRGLLNDEDILDKVNVLIDYAWEKLNTNLWVFVDKKWRYLYAYSTLYKILCSRNQLETDEIIKLCDLGLLICFFLIILLINSFTFKVAYERTFTRKTI